MKKFKKLIFLKVLTVIAWADGEVTNSELNVLKSFYRKFNLSKAQIKELDPYVLAPLPKKEQEELFKQLIAELNSPEDKIEIMQALQSMTQADLNIKEEESRLIEQFTLWLAKSTFTRRSFGKVRNFLKETLFKVRPEKNPELVRYFKQRVLKKIEIKSARNQKKPALDEETLYKICLLGTLLASVAHVDGTIDKAEKKALKKVLTDQFAFAAGEVKILLQVVEEQATEGFDFHEAATEFNRLFTHKERLALVDGFFAIAAADGDISHDETEEIRKITKALRVSHKQFIDSKVRALKANKG